MQFVFVPVVNLVALGDGASVLFPHDMSTESPSVRFGNLDIRPLLAVAPATCPDANGSHSVAILRRLSSQELTFSVSFHVVIIPYYVGGKCRY